MIFLRVDHTGIAVPDMDSAIEQYRRLYGVQPSERSLIQNQRVEVAFLPVGTTQLELVCPTDNDSGVARFLQKRGPGLHHVGMLVQDIDVALETLAREGVELIDRAPRQGVHGRIAFVHPRSNGGVLLELVENRRDQDLTS